MGGRKGTPVLFGAMPSQAPRAAMFDLVAAIRAVMMEKKQEESQSRSGSVRVCVFTCMRVYMPFSFLASNASLLRVSFRFHCVPPCVLVLHNVGISHITPQRSSFR